MALDARHLVNTILPGQAARSKARSGVRSVISSKQHRAMLALLAEFVQPAQLHTHEEAAAWETVLGMTYPNAIRVLITSGFLKLHRSGLAKLTMWLKQLARLEMQVEALVVTEKGQKAAALHRETYAKKQQSALKAVDQCFAAGNLQTAAHIIAQYNAAHLPPYPGLWKGAKGPSDDAITTAQIILEAQPEFLNQLDADPDEIQALRFQAAEKALTNVFLFDRITKIDRPLHPKGNVWLIKNLYAYGRQQATLLHQAERANVQPGAAVTAQQDAARPQADAHQAAAVNDMDTVLENEVPFENLLPRVRVPVRLKITLPYVFLALVFALVGAYLISQVVVESLEDRFMNQLIEVGKLSTDRMVLEETQRLETLRLLANINGVADAVMTQDAEKLRELALPIAVNTQEEAVEFLDMQGQSVLTMRHRYGEDIASYSFTRADSTFSGLPFVANVLHGEVDQGRDKFAGVVHLPEGIYFYVAGPLFNNAGDQVGVVLVGKSLNTLVLQFRQDTLAHTTFYNLDGRPLASSLLTVDTITSPLSTEQVASVLDNQKTSGMVRDLPIASINYSELIGTWEARGGSDIGLIGAALPQTFLARTSDTTRIQIFLLIAVGLLLVIGAGIYLSRTITRPLLKIVQASAQVARGDLDVNVKPVGNDEVAVLAHAFNHMMQGLREATERRLREIELLKALEHERELRELKSRFVSMVSHEFRTPLTTILSSSEFIRMYANNTSEDKKEKHFDRIQMAVANMKQLLEEVLVIGKTEAGRLEFNPSAVDIVKLCQDLVDEMQTNARSTHTIHLSNRVSSPIAEADEKLLRLAITNLLSNAIKYSPAGGPVYFDLAQKNGSFTIRVKDQGVGIPEKDQKRLFETFHRAQNVANIPGTGLGLYITKMAVELHSGTIDFESKEGVGTIFKVTIPVSQSVEMSA